VTVRREIDASNEQFLEELARGDAIAAAAAYDPHAILLPPTGEAIRGRNAIESFWRSGIEIGVGTVELETFECGDAGRLIYDVGRYRMLLERADREPKLERGAYLVLYRQEPDGSWRRAVDMFNATAPSQPPRSEAPVNPEPRWETTMKEEEQ
jgi:ketosteroid isomerase-like protein